jgi:hypothetical protein
MEKQYPFENLRFTRPRRPSVKVITIGVSLVAFAAAWWLMPHATLAWLMMPIQAALLWVAGYGWRDAIRALQTLLRRLEQA